MSKLRLVIGGFVLPLALVVACAGKDLDSPQIVKPTLTLTTDNLAFGSQQLAVEKGQPVHLLLDNRDTLVHDFTIDRISVVDKSVQERAYNLAGVTPDLHVSARPGQTATLMFTPMEAGTYTYYCTVLGHRTSGMQGVLTVHSD